MSLPDIGNLVSQTPDGGTLVLPLGVYGPDGGGNYVQHANFVKGITVTAEPGTVVNGIVSQDSSGITWQLPEIAVAEKQACAVIFQGGSNNSVVGGVIHGLNVGDGEAIRIGGSPNALVQNVEIHNVGVGLGIVASDGTVVQNCNIHDIQVDGMQFNSSSDVQVLNNTFDGFFPVAGDHSDCIQFQTVGQTKRATGITVKGNTYVRTRGLGDTQGIFMGNESSFNYADVLVEDNIFLGTVWHGITVSDAQTCSILNNLVVSYNDEGDIVAWIAEPNCTSGALRGNKATSFNTLPSSLAKSKNTLVRPIKLSDASALAAAWRALHG